VGLARWLLKREQRGPYSPLVLTRLAHDWW